MGKETSREGCYPKVEFLLTTPKHFEQANSAIEEVWKIQDQNHWPRTNFKINSSTDTEIIPKDELGQTLLHAILVRDNIPNEIRFAKEKETGPQIACQVSAGLFSSERGVLVNFPDGKSFSAFVDKGQVSYQDSLYVGENVLGFVKVRVVEYTPDGSVYIDLPGEDIMTGSRFKVPKDIILNDDPRDS